MFKKLKYQKQTKIHFKTQEIISQKYICILDFKFNNQTHTNEIKICEIEKFGKYIVILSTEGNLLTYNINNHKKKINALNNFVNLKFCEENEFKGKSIYCNKLRNTIIVIYIIISRNNIVMKCCELTVSKLKQLIKHVKSSNERPVFKDYFETFFKKENLKSIEFDEINNKVITKDANGVFKVWNLTDYKLIFEVSDGRIEEIRVTFDSLMTIQKNDDTIKLKTLDITTGCTLTINYLTIVKNVIFDLIEFFETSILIKQESLIPVLFNLETAEIFKIERHSFTTNSHFTYNPKAKIIVAMNEINIQLFYLNGELIRTIDRLINYKSEGYVHCSSDFQFLFLYFSSKVMNPTLNDSFIKDNSTTNVRNYENNIKTNQSKKNIFFTDSVHKEISIYDDDDCIEKFLKSDCNSKSSDKDLEIDHFRFENRMDSGSKQSEKTNENKLNPNIDILCGEFELFDNFDLKMDYIATINTDKAVFSTDNYEENFIKDYSDYLTSSILQDELKCFIFDQISKKMYLATNKGKIIEIRL